VLRVVGKQPRVELRKLRPHRRQARLVENTSTFCREDMDHSLPNPRALASRSRSSFSPRALTFT